MLTRANRVRAATLWIMSKMSTPPRYDPNSLSAVAPRPPAYVAPPQIVAEPPRNWFIRHKFLTLLGLALLLPFALFAIFGSRLQPPDRSNQARAPYTSVTAKDDNFTDVIAEFRHAGFTNVQADPIRDLVLGILTKDGAVESISISGNRSFDTTTWYPKDAPVVVKYHTFPLKEEKPTPEPDATVPDTPPAVTESKPSATESAHPSTTTAAPETPPATTDPAQSDPALSSEPEPDAATEPEPQPGPDASASAPQSVYYKNCAEAKAAGAAPIHAGDPGYRAALDRDKDGVACE